MTSPADRHHPDSAATAEALRLAARRRRDKAALDQIGRTDQTDQTAPPAATGGHLGGELAEAVMVEAVAAELVEHFAIDPDTVAVVVVEVRPTGRPDPRWGRVLASVGGYRFSYESRLTVEATVTDPQRRSPSLTALLPPLGGLPAAGRSWRERLVRRRQLLRFARPVRNEIELWGWFEELSWFNERWPEWAQHPNAPNRSDGGGPSDPAATP